MNLKEKLDRVFSIYIRTKNARHDGFVKCYTCGKVIHWKEADAGHFIRRGYSSVRFDERNVKVQCVECNQFKNGMEESFEEQLRYDLGEKEFNELVEKGKEIIQFTDEDYKKLIHKYTLLIREKGYTI
jgi:hypothetical protein